MAASGEPAPARQARRGPAPIASFDHDGSDESSPETKQSFRLPEIREDTSASRAPSATPPAAGESLAPPEQRARSHSTPAATALAAPPAPRIDISRASSSSHHDSRDSSPELALFAGGGTGEEARASLELGFREDGALDLRSSTEELAFLEPAPGEPPAAPPARPASAAPPPPLHERRHSRKDSQSSEAALLGVSGRTSRLSSVGSQCSAQSALSALSRVSRLSVVSGASRSPSPHRMLLETSFCGPKPIETDPEICAGAVVEQILGIVKMSGEPTAPGPPTSPAVSATPATHVALAVPVDARDRREVRTEVTVENARSVPVTPAVTVVAPPPAAPSAASPLDITDDEKTHKESKNRGQSEERKARPRIRREPSEPEVYKSRNKSKDIIIIKLKPDEHYGEEEEESERPATSEAARKPAKLELGHAARPADAAELGHTARPADAAPPSPAPSRRRSPSPAGPPVSRKSSFCSLFKSRETIASPESPSEALRRKRSLTEGRSRSKSRDRSATPTSTSKIRGSVLSLFRTPRRGGTSPSPSSRDGSPGVPATCSLAATPAPSIPPSDRRRADKLKYYEDTKDGIIHIPLRTPPEEQGAAGAAGAARRSSGAETVAVVEASPREPRPASAPQPRALPDDIVQPEIQARAAPAPQVRAQIELQPRIKSETTRPLTSRAPAKPFHRTVLPDGSIIIPLHSPTGKAPEIEFPETIRLNESVPEPKKIEEPVATSNRIEGSTVTPSREWTTSPPRVHTESRMPATPESPAQVEPRHEETRRRRKERLVFTTQVGSREQVFSTQFSITKTPSVTSEISGSFPSFGESEDIRAPLRDTHIAAEEPAAPVSAAPRGSPAGGGGSSASTPQDARRDSSESEPSSEAAPSRSGNDVERRGLVVQDSFEEELPYVPTTLPQERSVALPMVPVRDRGGVQVTGLQRPRGALPPARLPAPPPTPPPQAADKLKIKLPRRSRPSSASAAPKPEKPRTRSGGDSGNESRSKQEWIDFEEVPERRKQPKRIQTLPAAALAGAGAGGNVVFSYVEPEHCRCECHAARRDDQLPLLGDDMQQSRISSSSAECAEDEAQAQVELSVCVARPFTADFDVQSDTHVHTEPSPARQ